MAWAIKTASAKLESRKRIQAVAQNQEKNHMSLVQEMRPIMDVCKILRLRTSLPHVPAVCIAPNTNLITGGAAHLLPPLPCTLKKPTDCV